MKITNLFYKVAGAFFLTLATACMMMFGLDIFPKAGYPGVFFGLTGLLLLVPKRDTPPQLPPDVSEQMARLEKAIGVMQQELNQAQDELKNIADERDFMRQLIAKR